MNHIWPRVLIAAMMIAGMITLLVIGSVSESAAFGILGTIAGFFFGQFVPTPIEEPLGQ